MSVTFLVAGPTGPAAPPLAVGRVKSDAHPGLVDRAVDHFDVAAHLEAAGFGDAYARRHGAADVYDYARALPALPPDTPEPLSIRTRSPREGWVRALLLLAGAVVMALCAPAAVGAGAGAGANLSLTFIATGLTGWVLGQLVGFVTWRRAGLGDPAGAARRSVATAAIVSVPLLGGVTAATAVLGKAPLFATLALTSAWAVYAVSLTLVSVLGGLRHLALLAASCAVIAVGATVAGVTIIPLIALGVLSLGGAVLAARTYRATTHLPPTRPSRDDVRAAFNGAAQAALMSCALLLALNLADSDDRIPLSIAVILAAALCDPAIEDLGLRLRSLSYRSRLWRAVLAGVISRTLIYLGGIAVATISAAWVVDLILGTEEDLASGIVPDAVVLGVVAPIFAVFAFGSAIVLRAGRVGESVWISVLACLGFAVFRIGFPVALGVTVLCVACLLAVYHAVTAALHPHSW